MCGKNCQRALAGFARKFWQELPTNVGKHWFVRDAAKKNRRQRSQFTVAGSDPRSPKGFWRDSNAKNGVAPGHKMFFAASGFGLLAIALCSFFKVLGHVPIDPELDRQLDPSFPSAGLISAQV